MTLPPELKKAFREDLANLEHEQWIRWSQTVGERINFWKRTLSEENKKINVVKLDEIEFRMNAQLDKWEPNWVPYIELPEDVKDSDRIWADKVIVLFASFLENKRKELNKLTCYHPEERHSCYIEPENCLVNREEANAVFGVERK